MIGYFEMNVSQLCMQLQMILYAISLNTQDEYRNTNRLLTQVFIYQTWKVFEG